MILPLSSPLSALGEGGQSHTSIPHIVATPTATEWDALVRTHPTSHLLQYTSWGRLKARFGWHVERHALISTTTPPQLVAGAQMLFRSYYGFRFAYVPRGPLLSSHEHLNDLLLNILWRAARRNRAVVLRFEPNMLEDDPDAGIVHSWLLRHQFLPIDPIQPRTTIHVDLTAPVEQIFARCSKGHRADIRRAQRQGIHVRCGDASDLPSFSAIMQATAQRAQFAVHAPAYYDMAWILFQADSSSQLLFAEQDGHPLAAHMVFRDPHHGLYFYGGAYDEGMKGGANHLIQWHAMQWAHERGCLLYDLWGIPDALGLAATYADPNEQARLQTLAQDDPLIGVYRFKKGFGGRIVRYLPAYDRVIIPPLYHLWRRSLT